MALFQISLLPAVHEASEGIEGAGETPHAPQSEVPPLRKSVDVTEITPSALLGRLSKEEFKELHTAWLKHTRTGRHELTRKAFDAVLQPFAEKAFPGATPVAIHEALGDLFRMVDVGGSGMVTWDSFTSCLIDQAIRGQANKIDIPQNVLRYGFARTVPGINTAAGAEDTCKKVVYCPSVHQLLVCTRTHRVKLCDPMADFATVKTFEHDAPILDACYVVRQHQHIGNQHIVLTSSADLRIRAFAGPKHDYTPMSQVHLKESQMVLRWCAATEHLYTGSRKGDVMKWSISQQGTFAHLGRLTGHTQPVMDIYTLPRRIFTASLDSRLMQWELERTSCKPTVFEGHQKGIYSIAYIEESKLILTAGFEFHVMCWMEGQPGVSPFRLEDPNGKDGHKDSLIRVVHVPGTPQVLTCDRGGLAKVWDIRKCLPVQTFRVFPEGYRHVLHEDEGDTAHPQPLVTDFTYLSQSRHIVAVTPKEAFLYEYEGRAHTFSLESDSTASQAAALRKELEERRTQLRNHVALTKHLTSEHSLTQAAQSLRRDAAAIKHEVEVKADQLQRMLRHVEERIDPMVAHETRVHMVMAVYAAGRFITAASHETKLWDAHTGHVLLYLTSFFHGAPVTAGCVDGVGRRFILGAADGRVGLFRASTGAVMRDFSPPHHGRSGWGEITSLCYIDTERAVMATALRGAGGVVLVWGDKEGAPASNKSSVPPTKKVEIPSTAKVLLSSPGLGLTVLGDEAGVVHCYSYDSQASGGVLNKVHTCGPLAGEVCALAPLVPYPAFVASDAGAFINLWTVRPYYYRDCLVARWENVAAESGSAGDVFTPNITALAWQHPYTLYGGDEVGRILSWNLSDIVLNARLQDAAWNTADRGRGKQIPFSRPRHDRMPPPTLMFSFRPHSDGIISLQFIPPSTLLSAALDNKIHLWRLGSEAASCIGMLTLCAGQPGEPPWRFKVPSEESGRKAALSPLTAARFAALREYVKSGRFHKGAQATQLRTIVGMWGGRDTSKRAMARAVRLLPRESSSDEVLVQKQAKTVLEHVVDATEQQDAAVESGSSDADSAILCTEHALWVYRKHRRTRHNLSSTMKQHERSSARTSTGGSFWAGFTDSLPDTPAGRSSARDWFGGTGGKGGLASGQTSGFFKQGSRTSGFFTPAQGATPKAGSFAGWFSQQSESEPGTLKTCGSVFAGRVRRKRKESSAAEAVRCSKDTVMAAEQCGDTPVDLKSIVDLLISPPDPSRPTSPILTTRRRKRRKADPVRTHPIPDFPTACPPPSTPPPPQTGEAKPPTPPPSPPPTPPLPPPSPSPPTTPEPTASPSISTKEVVEEEEKEEEEEEEGRVPSERRSSLWEDVYGGYEDSEVSVQEEGTSPPPPPPPPVMSPRLPRRFGSTVSVKEGELRMAPVPDPAEVEGLLIAAPPALVAAAAACVTFATRLMRRARGLAMKPVVEERELEISRRPPLVLPKETSSPTRPVRPNSAPLRRERAVTPSKGTKPFSKPRKTVDAGASAHTQAKYLPLAAVTYHTTAYIAPDTTIKVGRPAETPHRKALFDAFTLHRTKLKSEKSRDVHHSSTLSAVGRRHAFQ